MTAVFRPSASGHTLNMLQLISLSCLNRLRRSRTVAPSSIPWIRHWSEDDLGLYESNQALSPIQVRYNIVHHKTYGESRSPYVLWWTMLCRTWQVKLWSRRWFVVSRGTCLSHWWLRVLLRVDVALSAILVPDSAWSFGHSYRFCAWEKFHCRWTWRVQTAVMETTSPSVRIRHYMYIFCGNAVIRMLRRRRLCDCAIFFSVTLQQFSRVHEVLVLPRVAASHLAGVISAVA